MRQFYSARVIASRLFCLERSALSKLVSTGIFLCSAVCMGAVPAEQVPAGLSWVRASEAASCSSGPEIARLVEQHLGRAALVPLAEARLVIEAFVAPRPEGGFHVSIALVKDQVLAGRRDLESTEPTCRDVSERAALAIALMIDPEAPGQGEGALRDQPLPGETLPTVTPRSVSSEATTRVEPPVGSAAPLAVNRPLVRRAELSGGASVLRLKRPWQAELELATGVVSGVAPGFAPAVFARGRVGSPTSLIEVDIEGAYVPERSLETEAHKGSRFALLYTGLALCGRTPGPARVGASLCAGADLGSLAGRGYGFEHNATMKSAFVALSARARLCIRVHGHFNVVLGPDLVLPLRRDYFETQSATGTEGGFRMSAAGFGFELGAVWGL